MSTLFFDIETVGHKFTDDNAPLSPTTAMIASLSVYDLERAEGTVYLTTHNQPIPHDGEWKLKVTNEKKLLQDFWNGIESYDVYVGFATRRYDVPFITHRSIAQNVETNQRLNNHRILSRQRLPFHVDLHDEFSFQGAMSTKLTLRALTELYGIENNFYNYDALKSILDEKNEHKLFCHCQQKLMATVELYKKWQKHLAPPQFLNTIEL